MVPDFVLRRLCGTSEGTPSCRRGSYFTVEFVGVGMDYNLDLADVEFLRTVRRINENPDEFDHTTEAECPASTRSIREVSDLSRKQVRYRLGGSSSRGLEDAGLTIVHSAVYDEEKSQYGPKSVELTEQGRMALEQAEHGVVSDQVAEKDELDELRERVDALESTDIEGDVDTNAVVDELRAVSGRLEALENTVERIDQEVATMRDEVSAIQESDWGEIDDDIVEDLVLLLRRAPAMLYGFNSVLGLDIDQIVDDGAFSEDELRDAHEELFVRLASAADVPVDELSVNGQSADGQGQGSQAEIGETKRDITPPSVTESEMSSESSSSE